MKPRGGTRVSYGSAKRQKGEEKERRAVRRKGRQNDRKIIKEQMNDR